MNEIRPEDFEGLCRKVDDIHTSIVGDLENPGVMERLRSLEKQEGKRQKLIWTVITALVGLGAKVFYGHK